MVMLNNVDDGRILLDDAGDLDIFIGQQISVTHELHLSEGINVTSIYVELNYDK